MKQYVVDELRLQDVEKLKAHLDHTLPEPTLAGVYRLPLESSLLSTLQRSHSDCGPFYFALELTMDRLSCEMLVRAEQRIRCDCIGEATAAQRNWLMDTIDAMLETLGIRV